MTMWPVRRPARERQRSRCQNATATRAGASASSAAAAEAFTIGWRRLGTSTPGPKPILVVRSAASANIIHTSGLSCGASNNHARS